MRDAGVVTFSWPSHIGVPPPAGVPVDSPVPGSPRSPDSASPQRPSSSTRQVLDPYDLGPLSSSHGKAPASRGSSAASPVGDTASLPNDDDHALSDDIVVSTPPLEAGSSPVVLPVSPVSLASSPSPPASVNEAAAVPDERYEVPEQPESDNATLQMPPNHTCLLQDQARLLRSLLRDPPSDESWAQCEEAWTQAVALAVAVVRLPPVRPGRQRRQPDPSNAVDIQRLYHCNRLCAVRLIQKGPPQTCAIPLQDHWGRMWSARQADSTLLLGRDPAPAGVDTTDFTPDDPDPSALQEIPEQWVSLATLRHSNVLPRPTRVCLSKCRLERRAQDVSPLPAPFARNSCRTWGFTTRAIRDVALR
ncbi:hypothetical protein MRX96_055423 [Rhipicephalus microplus]